MRNKVLKMGKERAGRLWAGGAAGADGGAEKGGWWRWKRPLAWHLKSGTAKAYERYA